MEMKNIQTLEELFSLSETIYDFLKEKFEASEISVLEDRGHEIAAYMCNTGKMLSDARYWRDEAVKNSILKQVGANIPASTLNELIKSTCKNENYLVNWIEQLDKECKYQLEWIRSCLSKAKTEMQMSSYMGSVR